MTFLHRGSASTTDAAKIQALLGPTTATLSSIQAMGTIANYWVNTMLTYTDAHWGYDLGDYSGIPTHAGGSGGANGGAYYDRPSLCYQLYMLTGDSKWKTRGNAYVTDLINGYYIPNSYSGNNYLLWAYAPCLIMYDQLNGGTTGLVALGKLADTWISTWLPEAQAGPRGGSPDMDPRQLGRGLILMIYAAKYSAPSPAGNNFNTYLASTLTATINWQDSDGGLRTVTERYHSEAFMAGILCDAWYQYLDAIGADARIKPAIKLAMDYLIAYNYWPTMGAMSYQTASVYPNTSSGDSLNTIPAKGTGTVPLRELNAFIYRIMWRVGRDQGETGPSGFYTGIGDWLFVNTLNLNHPCSQGVGQWPVNSYLGSKPNNEQFADYTLKYWDDRLAMSTAPMQETTLNSVGSEYSDVPFPYSTAGLASQGASGLPAHPGTAWRWNTSTASAVLVARMDCPAGAVGTIELWAKIPASGGMSQFYAQLDNDAGTILMPATLINTPVTTSWAKVGIYNANLTPSGVAMPGYAVLKLLNSNGTTTFSGIVDICALYMGLGSGGEAIPTQTPHLDWHNVIDPEPTITGTLGSGNTLTRVPGTYYGGTPTSFDVQWFRDGLAIAGQTGNTYLQTGADTGHYIFFAERAHNANGAGTWVEADARTVS